MDKATLLDNISAGYEALEKMVAPLNEAQMTTVGVNGEWSIKDVLVHLISWQRRILSDMQAAIHDEEPALPTLHLTQEEVDRLNEQFYKESRTRSLNEVLSDFQATHSQMMAAIQAMTGDDLINPGRFAWTGGKPLWQSVAAETYEHILEHIGSIHVWLTTTK